MASEETVEAAEASEEQVAAEPPVAVVKERYEISLPRPKPQKRLRAHIALRRIIRSICSQLPALCSSEDWTSVRRCLQLLLWWAQQVQGAARDFVAAKGTVRVQGVVRAAVQAGPQSAGVGGVLEAAAGLLLVAVRASEAAADLVVESEMIRLLLGVLVLPGSTPATKRSIAELLAALAASKLVYKDVLQGAGVMTPLLSCLTDGAALCDLVLLQHLLRLLICLCDDDVVYKDYMREEGVPAALVALLAGYQTQGAAPELRPIAAQVSRALHLLSHDDDQMKEQVRGLGLIHLLVAQLRHDVGVLAQPSGPALPSPTAGYGLNHAHSSSGGPAGRSPRSSFAVSPRSSRPNALPGLMTDPGSGGLLLGGGPGSSLATAAIPEESEGVMPPSSNSPFAYSMGHFSVGRNVSFQARHVEAGVLRAAGIGPPPLQRVCAALLVRAVAPAAGVGARTAQVLVHTTLLPLLHMQLVSPRLSLALETISTLKALLCDSPANQAAAYEAGVVVPLVKLLHTRNLDMAAQAAEAITNLGQYQADWLAQGAVPALAELLGECAAHAQAVGLHERHHSSAGTDPLFPGAGGKSSSGVGASTATAAAAQPAAVHWGPVTGSANGGLQTSGRGLSGRQRARVSVQGTVHCLVCSHWGEGTCGFCPLSQVLKALLRVMTTDAATQGALVAAGGLPLLFSLMRQEAGQQHSRLMASLLALVSLTVVHNREAQEVTRACGGLEALGACLTALGPPKQGGGDIHQLRASCLAALTAAVQNNAAAQVTARQQGVLAPIVTLLRALVGEAGVPHDVEDGEQLLAVLLEAVAALTPGVPANQEVLHSSGITHLFIQLLMSPTAAQHSALQRATATALSHLVAGHTPAAQLAATACVPAWLLQQIRAPPTVTALQVYSAALPRLLRGCPPACQQVVEGGGVQLLVQILGSCSDRPVQVAVAQSIEALASSDQVVAGRLVTAGGVIVLLSLLAPPGPGQRPGGGLLGSSSRRGSVTAAVSSGGADGTPAEVSSQPAAAAGGGNAVYSSRGSAAGAESSQQQQGLEGEGDGPAVDGVGAGGGPPALPPIRTSSSSGGMAAAAADGSSAWDAAVNAATAGVAAAAAAAGGGGGAAAAGAGSLGAGVSLFRVQASCLRALLALAHDNTFTKNAARGGGAFSTLGELLAQLGPALEASALAAHTTCLGQVSAARSSSSSRTNSRRRLHTSPQDASSHSSWQLPGELPGENSAMEAQILEQLAVMQGAVQLVGELCRSNHTNQDLVSGEQLLQRLAALLALAVGEGLDTAAAHGGLIAALVGAVGAAVEFHGGNKVVCRECGVLDVLSRLILMVGEAPDITSLLSSLGLQPALAAALVAVASLSQDCEEDQRSFLAAPSFLPTLWRLMAVGNPAVAAAAAKAFEFIAVRTDIRDDADDRSEFELDTIQTIVKLLSKGAVGAGGVPNVSVLGAAGSSSIAAAVREASDILAAVVVASDPEAPTAGSREGGAGRGGGGPAKGPSKGTINAAAGGGGDGGGKGRFPGSNQSSRKSLGGAAAPPSAFQAAAGGGGGQGAGNGYSSSSGGPLGGGGGVEVGLGGSSELLQPSALLPAVVTDHSSGLAVLRTWSVQQDPSEYWRGLVGRAAPAFPPVAAAVAPGPWKPLQEQLAWVLLLLGLKQPSNRQLMSRLQRATLAPLASQLAAAEKYAATAAAASGNTAAGGGGGAGPAGTTTSSSSRSSGGGVEQGGSREASLAGSFGRPAAAAAAGPPGQAPAAAATGASLPRSGAAAGAGGGGGGGSLQSSYSAGGAAAAGGPAGATHVLEEEGDGFDMLQQEVAFLQLAGGWQPPPPQYPQQQQQQQQQEQ